jgi:short-subunit dehydrogenase
VNKGWAIVTGASSGIGMAYARELSRRGFPVLAVARRRERLDELARESSSRGGMLETFVADLTTESGLRSVVSRAAELGEVELLVNNAGMANGGDFLGVSLEQEIRAVRLNIEAVVTLTHEILEGMVRRKRGAIVNLASVVAFQPFPHFAVYAATKAFVLSFTESLAEEIKGTGVKVVALCPGSVRTEIDMFAHNEGLLGKLPSLTADEVVQAGLDTVDRGGVVKVVGWLNRFLPLMGRFLPRSTVRWLMGVSAKPPRPLIADRAGI